MGTATGVLINGRPTNGANPYIDSLNGGTAWRNENGAAGTVYLSYTLQQGIDPYGALVGGGESYAWDLAWTAAIKSAFASYEAVCNVKFQETTADSADLWYWLANNTQVGSDRSGTVLGWHEFPYYGMEPLYGAFNRDYASNVSPGSLMYGTLVHELGHGLGLAHPHDGGYDISLFGRAQTFPGVTNAWSTGTDGLNQGIWTVMSYNDGWTGAPTNSYAYGYTITPMALDIAALQGMYGANTTTALGDDTYILPAQAGVNVGWACIWDCGGTDTISNEGSAVAAVINLNQAPLIGPNAGGYVSWDKSVPGGFTIANGVTIENAIGGSGNDLLTGNEANNTLTGGDGADTLIGGAGTDTLLGGAGDDLFVLTSLTEFTLTEMITGAAGLDEFRFTAAAGSTLVLNEKISVERVVIGTGTGANAVTSGSLKLNVNAADYADANGLTILGNAGANSLTGSRFADRLEGGAGVDVMLGGTGADRLTGGTGHDTLTGGGDADTFVFNTLSGIDRVRDFVHLTDRIELAKSAMGALGNLGVLSPDAFYAGASAHDKTDRILYKQSTGALYYDADGKGGRSAVQIAVLENRPVLTADDFWVA